MRKCDRPVSFLVRPWMPRTIDPANLATTKETSPIPPQTVVLPPMKEPPQPRPYMVKGKKVDIHPDAVFQEMDGDVTVLYEGAGRKLPPEVDTKRIPHRIGSPPLPVLNEPIPGTLRQTRGRDVPRIGTAEAMGRKHLCTLVGCGKVFKKRAHLRRHINSVHRPEYAC